MSILTALLKLIASELVEEEKPAPPQRKIYKKPSWLQDKENK